MKFTKSQAFIISFLCYASIHSLRTTYSYIKSYLPDELDVSIASISIIDSLLLLFLGIGHFLHAIKPVVKPIKMLWIGTISVALSYALIPLCMQVVILSQYWILLILMCLNGYLQSYTWPHLLMMLHFYFDPKHNNILVGFWATDTNVGNIIGYIICQIFIKQEHWAWQSGMALVAGFCLFTALWIMVRAQQIPVHTDQKPSLLSETVKEETDEQILERVPTVKSVFKDINIIIITVTFSLDKSVIYGILLWLPLYFKSQSDLSPYAAEIPMAYDLASIAGSIFIGYLFRRINNKGFLLNPFMFVLFACFVLLRTVILPLWGYFFVIACVGFSLGGTFNSISGLIVCELANKIPERYRSKSLGFFAALTMAVGNITTALTQILIGFIVGKENESAIFGIFIIYIGVCILCLSYLSFITCKKNKEIIIEGEQCADS